MNRRFSTGLPAFDHAIGGLLPAESLLLIVSAPGQASLVAGAAAEDAAVNRTGILLCRAGEAPILPPSVDARKTFHAQSRRDAAPLLRAVGRHAGLVLFDDLSLWKALLGGEKGLLKFYAALPRSPKRVVIASALRSSFTREGLAALKESATTCVEIVLHNNESYARPVSLRGKYVAPSLLPLKLDRRELAREAPGDLPEGEEIPAAFAGSVAYDELFRQGPEPMLIFDARGDLRLGNKRFASMSGMSNDDLAITPPLSLVAADEKRPALRFLAALRQRKKAAVTLSLRGKRIAVHGAPVGKSLVLALLRDVTAEEKAARSVDAAGALAVAEQRFRSLVERSAGAAAVLRDGAVAWCNEAFVALFGFESREAAAGRDISTLVAEPEKLRKKQGATVAASATRADGSTFDAGVRLVQVRESGDTLLFVDDLTETRRLAESLRRQTSEAELLGRIIPSLQHTLELKKIPHAALHRLLEALGWPGGALYLAEKAELRMASHRNLPAPLEAKLGVLSLEEGIGAYILKTLEPHLVSVSRYPSYLPFRGLFRDAGIAHFALIPLSAGDKLEGMLLLAAKGKAPAASSSLLAAIGNTLGSTLAGARALAALKDSSERKEALFATSPVILYTALPAGGFLSVNAGIERLTGYTVREFLRTPALWLKLVHPDDKRILLERTANLGDLGAGTVSEYRVLPKGKAVYRWVRDAVTIARDEKGEITALYGTMTDTTGERAEIEGLRAEHDLHAGMLAGMHDGVAAFDRSFHCTAWNPAMERLTGIKASNAAGRTAEELLPGYAEAGLAQMLSRASAGEAVTTPDIHYRKKGGAGYYLGRLSPMTRADGEIPGVVGVFVDVSAQKSIETEMRESEQIFSNVIDTMGDILVITDLGGRVLQVNRAFLRLLGFSRAEAVGREFPHPWLIEEEMGRFVLWIANLRERNWLHDFDMTWQARDGRLIPMSLSTTLLRNSLGEPIAMLNIARDITERKRLARDLENRNRQIELINRIVGKGNETLDFDEIFTTLAREIHEVVPADFIGVGILTPDRKTLRSFSLVGRQAYLKDNPIPLEQTVSRLAVEGGKPVIVPDLLADPACRGFSSVLKGMRSHIAIPMRLKETILGTLNVGSREPHVYSDEVLRILDPVAQQTGAIIDRIRLFQQVSEDSAYIHNLLDSIDSIVFTVDSRMMVREVNKAWQTFQAECGADPSVDDHGRPLFDVLTDPGLREMIAAAAPDLLAGRRDLFLQEFVQATPAGGRTFQLTINPMVIDRKITGLVFTQADITPLKKTEARLKRNNERLLAVNEISTIISTSLDVRQILHAAVPVLRRSTGADAVAVYLSEGGPGGDLALASQSGFDTERYASILRLSPEHSMTGGAVSDRTPRYVSEGVADDPRIKPENRGALRHHGLAAMAAIPLTSKEKVLGALDVFYRERHDFSDQERQILTLVGTQLGAAIENTQLYTELRAQLDRLTVLYQLSQELTSTLSVDQIFQMAYAQILPVIPFRRFAIDAFDEAAGQRTPAFRVETIDGEKVFVTSVSQAEPIDPAGPEGRAVAQRSAYRSADGRTIVIPMMSKGSIIGILTAETGEEGPYGETHLLLLESIGNLTAIALEKGKLYEETLQKSLEIERRNKELDDFTYVVSHDLKEPLISIEGFARILQADYHDIIQQEGREYFESIVGATTRMKGLIDDLLLLSRVSRPSESFRSVDVKEILDEIRTDMEFTIRQKGVTLVLPESLPAVYGNATQLKIVFRNLIGNAVKFSKSAAPLVEVGFRIGENNSYLFSVRDNGIGIEKEFHEKIFVIFQRLHRREEYEGTGAGLAIVKKIIELHKGRIWVESELGRGSTFFFTVPRPPAQEAGGGAGLS